MSKILDKSYIPKGYKDLGPANKDLIISIKIIFSKVPEGDNFIKINYYVKEFALKQSFINTIFLDVSGRVGDIERLFGTQINMFSYNKKHYYSDVSDIIIPLDMNFVSDVIGLNNFPRFKHHTQLSPIEAKSYTPIELAELYNFPLHLRGSNRVISIIELGGGFKQSDLTYYFQNYLKITNEPQVYSLFINGALNNPNELAQEVTSDIEIAGAIAKCSTIIVYFAPNNELSFYEAIFFSLTNGNYYSCAEVISWGCPEIENRASYCESVNKIMEIGVKRNVSILCASGDNGSSDGLKGLNVDFPASAPNSVACGGTNIYVENNKIIDEVTWHGSGGGFSSIFPKPSYQTNVTGDKRGVPDIAGNADPLTGLIIYRNNKFEVVGGTGIVASLYSGLVALLSQAKGSVKYLNTIIYPIPNKVCYDVTEGSNGPNGKWDAEIGWDPCTGNGRIYGDKLLESLYF